MPVHDPGDDLCGGLVCVPAVEVLGGQRLRGHWVSIGSRTGESGVSWDVRRAAGGAGVRPSRVTASAADVGGVGGPVPGGDLLPLDTGQDDLPPLLYIMSIIGSC